MESTATKERANKVGARSNNLKLVEFHRLRILTKGTWEDVPQEFTNVTEAKKHLMEEYADEVKNNQEFEIIPRYRFTEI